MISIPDPAWGLLHRVTKEGRILVITGAGISVESGIRPYRSEDGTGVYEDDDEFNPLKVLRSDTVYHHPEMLWEYVLSRFNSVVRDAEPNRAHYALATLESHMGDRFGLVTQNIDGLHLKAGSSPERTIELHGSSRMRCSDECWIRNNDGVPEIWDIPEDASMDNLVCPRCGAFTRPHALMFDEAYSQELYRSEEATDWADRADVVITVGCSAVVPVAQILANTVVRNGGSVIDINPAQESTIGDTAEQQGMRLRMSAGDALPRLVDFMTA